MQYYIIWLLKRSSFTFNALQMWLLTRNRCAEFSKSEYNLVRYLQKSNICWKAQLHVNYFTHVFVFAFLNITDRSFLLSLSICRTPKMQTGVIIQVKEKQQHSMFLSVTHEAVRQKTWVLLVSSDLFHLICYNSLGKDTQLP